MINNISPLEFEKIPKLIGFRATVSQSGRFKVWRRQDTKLYLITPTKAEDKEGYEIYFQDNLKVLRKVLNINEDYTTDEFKDIVLSNKYPINNRIKTDFSFVPSDYLFNLLHSAMDAYRYFREYNKEFKKISKKNFEIGHSKKGSYKIPILVSVEEKEIQELMNSDFYSDSLIHVKRKPNIVLKSLVEFSKSLQGLNELPKLIDTTKFIDSALEHNLNSHIVETFLSPTKNFQRIKKQYTETIPNSYIEFESNPILDYEVEDDLINFVNVDTKDFNPTTEENIEKLRDYENEQDKNNLSEEDVIIECIVSNLRPRLKAQGGEVKVVVSLVEKNNKIVYDSSFTATIKEVSGSHYSKLADISKTNSTFRILGDVSKPPKKQGEIRVTKYLFETERKKEEELF